MAKPKCLITGCRLVWGSKHAWGDLHELGGCYIFNATLEVGLGNRCGETAWNEGREHAGYCEEEKQVWINGATYVEAFERRGVIVLAKQDVYFNPAACRHLEKWGDAK